MADCSRTSIGQWPIEDLGPATYQGEPGGLYPGGTNDPPADHLATGIAAGLSIQPINGKIGLISTGHSNATATFAVFKPMADAHPNKSPSLVIVDGAQGGKDTDDWIKSPSHPHSPWSTLAKRVQQAGLLPSQVQAMWFYHGEREDAESDNFPGDFRVIAQEYLQVIALAEQRYPNLKQVHLCSMTYMGYSISINPARQEPNGYRHQWATKWAIEADVLGTWTGRSWLGWISQQWCDGTTPSANGRTWLCEDVMDDGVHPSPIGAEKAAQWSLDFYLTNPTTPWFRV